MGLLLGASAISLIELFDWTFYKCFKLDDSVQNSAETGQIKTDINKGIEKCGNLDDNFQTDEQNQCSRIEDKRHNFDQQPPAADDFI